MPGYLFWLDSEGLQGGDRLATADPNENGIPNAIEFVLGGDPDGDFVGGLLPTMTINSDWAYFEFRRSDASAASGPAVEFGSTLHDWTTAVHGVGSVQITTEENAFGPGIDRVKVRIPKASPQLFMRLRASVLPSP